MAKVEIEHLTKIFGKRVKPALQMVQQQASKTEILKRRVRQLGSMTRTCPSKKEKFLSSWDYQDRVSQRLFDC